MKMRKRRINKLLLTGLLLFIITGCSTTKHLPEDELLYIGTPTPKIVGYNEADNGEATLEEVQGALNVAPNNSFSAALSIVFPSLWDYGCITDLNDTKKALANGFSRNWPPTRFMYLPSILIPVQR